MGVTATKDLRLKTGEFIRRLRAGETFTLTHRGKAIAAVTPATEQTGGTARDAETENRDWSDMLDALRQSKPRFGD